MLASLVNTPSWGLPPKQRLTTLLASPVHCRVAPSPTGHVHLGTVRTALHNALAARASGGSFLLRIDDTDATRNNDAHVDLIHKSLDLLGLPPDRCFHQSNRCQNHHIAVQALVDDQWAVTDQNAIRLAPAARGLAPDRFFDLASGVCQISATLLDHADNLVLLRSDGSPTYHLASIVDDIDAGITLILRGMDHLSNVPKQILIALALAKVGYPGAQDFCDRIVFAHVGLILKDGKKLSKRDNDSNLFHYLDAGTPRDALLHWALTLGWGHPDSAFDKTWPFIPRDDLPGVFGQGGLRSANCALNIDKLAALSRKYKATSPPHNR